MTVLYYILLFAMISSLIKALWNETMTSLTMIVGIREIDKAAKLAATEHPQQIMAENLLEKRKEGDAC